MADDNTQPQPQQPPAQPDYQALLQALIQRQMAVASGQGQQVQLPNLPAPQAQTQYSNDPSKGPDLLERIGLALGGGSLPGAPAELQAQMGRQGLLNFGIGLMSAGKFATPGEVFAGGLRGAQQGLLGSEAAQAGQQEYAIGSREKLAELGLTQQKNQTEALTSILPLIQMSGRLGLPPLFGPGSGAGGAGGPGGGGPPGGGGGDTALTGDMAHDQPIIAARESGGNPHALNYVAMQDPSAYARGATASGKYQFVNSTWQEGLKLAGIDPNQYPTAMSAPENVQDQVFKAVYGKYGTAPWDASKFTSNWVAQPGGGYQLVKGAQPPASGPGSAVGPYKPPGTATAAATPPAAPATPPGGGGQPSIGSELQPPTPGSAANVVPGLSAADAAVIAKQSGRDVPFGNQGMVAHADGTVGTGAKGSGGGISGKRADAGQVGQDVAAIQGGMQGASGGAPGGVLAAGPAAQAGSIGGALAPPTPGLAANVAAPVGPIRSPAVVAQPPPAETPPAVTPQQPPAPTPQPPAATPAKPPIDLANTPDLDLDPEQYAQKHHTDLTPEQVRALTPGVSSDEAQATAQNVLDAKKQLASAQANYTRVAQGSYGQADVNRSMDAVNKAQEALATAQTAYGVEVDKLQGQGADRLAQREKDEQARLTANYTTNVSNVKAAATLSQATIRQKAAESEIASDQGIMQGIDKTTESAHDTLQTLEAAKALSVAAGNKSNLATYAPGVAMALQRNGLLSADDSNKLDAQHALDGVLSQMAGTMRQSMGFSRMTNMDLQFLQNITGTSNLPESQRRAMFAFMQTALERQYQYGSLVRELYGGGPQLGGITLSQAREQADAKLGHIVQTVPEGLSPKAHDGWVSQTVTPGTFYVDGGQLKIRGAAGGGQPQ